MFAFGSAFYPSLEVNTLRALVGNLQIFVRIRIRILPVVESADPQIRMSADPHFTRSQTDCRLQQLTVVTSTDRV